MPETGLTPEAAREPTRASRERRWGEYAYPVISIALFFGAWQLAVTTEWVTEFFLPGPAKVFKQMALMVADGSLFVHIGVSLARVAAGFALAVVIALPLGMAIGLWPVVFHVVDPWIELVRPIPPIAWIPLVILWLGLGEVPKVAIIAYGAFFPIVLNTLAGLRGVERVHIWAALSLGVKPRQIFWQVVLRSALPNIVVGLRLGAGMAFVVLVAAELILAYSGLGFLIQDGRNQLMTDQIIVGIVTIGILGYIINKGLLWLENKWIPYRETVSQDS